MSKLDRDDQAFALPPARPAPPQDSMLYGIQVLRAVAALLVVVRHSVRDASHVPDMFAVGQIGVDIFFVISGVVIALTSRHLKWHVFLRRRIARIVPLYWLLLLIPVIGALIRTQYGQSLDISGNAIAAFFFIPYGGIYPPIFVGWTLNFEMWFYLICAGVLYMGSRATFHRTVSLVIGWVVLIGLPILALNDWEVTPATLLLMPISLEFLGGLWLARAWQSGMRSSPVVAALLLIGAVAWLAIAPAATVTAILRPLLWGPPALAIVWAVMSLERHLPFARWRAALLLGEASYALYLIHPRVLEASGRLLPRFGLDLPVAVLAAIMIAGALVAGVALHLMVERPMLRWSKKLLGLGPRPIRSAEASVPSVERPLRSS